MPNGISPILLKDWALPAKTSSEVSVPGGAGILAAADRDSSHRDKMGQQFLIKPV
jgi:hypothetical protein